LRGKTTGTKSYVKLTQNKWLHYEEHRNASKETLEKLLEKYPWTKQISTMLANFCSERPRTMIQWRNGIKANFQNCKWVSHRLIQTGTRTEYADQQADIKGVRTVHQFMKYIINNLTRKHRNRTKWPLLV